MSIFIDQSIRSSVGGYTKDKFVSGRSGFDVELNGRVLKFHDHFREFLCKYGALGYYERNRRDNLLEVAGLTLKKKTIQADIVDVCTHCTQAIVLYYR